MANQDNIREQSGQRAHVKTFAHRALSSTRSKLVDLKLELPQPRKRRTSTPSPHRNPTKRARSESMSISSDTLSTLCEGMDLWTPSSRTPPILPPTDVERYLGQIRPNKKTREHMIMRNRRLFLISDRSGMGGHVPMIKTKHPLTQRRYSIDVNTEGWHRHVTPHDTCWSVAPTLRYVQWFDEATWKEIEPPATRTPRLLSPDPQRYKELTKFLNPRIPIDDETYVELPDSSLTREDFLMIPELGVWSWLRDNAIGVAFELISRNRECKENQIEIANPMVSQVLYSLWREHDEGVLDLTHFKTEFDRFQDKYWIFLPINDAYGSDDATQTVGMHWSLIAYNRMKGTAHYIDSMWDENNVSQAITGLRVMKGLSLLLGEDFHFQIERETPNQYLQNQCKQDMGPCGPFIIAMVDHYILAIKEAKKYDDVQDLDFGIEKSFADEWYFDSRFVRWYISKMIFEEWQAQEVERRAAQHTADALAE